MHIWQSGISENKMNKFKDFIEIDKKFQNSINLQLDIDNLSKLNSYIPTHSSIF